MKSADELRRQAGRYRRMRRQIIDPTAVQAISDAVDELELTAEEIERRHQIRERAHALWATHGRPEGRDMEFWLVAEREVDIQRRR